LAFVKAHYESGYEEGKAKSNSLLYIYNADTDKASWATYDVNLDPWTKEYLGENQTCYNFESNSLFSKYNSGFTYVAPAPKKNSKTYRRILNSIAGNKRYLKLRISLTVGKSL
jgi:hypothetical protein